MDVWESVWATRCIGCDAEGQGGWCPACEATLAVRRIDRPLEGIRGIWTPAPYEGPVGTALQRAKYGPRWRPMRTLAHAYAHILGPWVVGGAFDAVVDVPSPWGRRMHRGFATGAVLADALARHTGVPWIRAVTMEAGARNAGLSRAGRRRNLAGRVRAVRGAPGRVLLVDDVLTTGATAEACARELLGTESAAVWFAPLCVAEPASSANSHEQRAA